MAEGLELFHVPQKVKTENKLQSAALLFQTRSTTTPSPLTQRPSPLSIGPNDAALNFHHDQMLSPSSRHAAINSSSHPPGPLYRLFSDDMRNGVVSLRPVDHLSLPDPSLRSSVPLGPFTGYASILRRSSFLKPAQQLLEEFCGLDRRVWGIPTVDEVGCKDRSAYQFKNSSLIFMLEEIYKRCKLYCQQIQSVVTSFETVAGLGNAALFVSSAIRAILNHFGSLKIAILDQLNFSAKNNSCRTNSLGHNPIHNLTNFPRSAWRSQRGLPEHAVAVLRKWLFEHFLHPYPTDSEKQMLTQQTGLSRTQVSNWFINSRVRLWKPMVEEIQGLQTQQNQSHSDTTMNHHANGSTPSLKSYLDNPISMENLRPGEKGREILCKRSTNDRHHHEMMISSSHNAQQSEEKD
ncbi:BEL1-like homeodomain protein 9 isoform X2 [Humulus lupulus]|uniref:BEL1-like homeodomain protein 9 isoform X2 n=1 Tax=Humulus lupulus TaxID=3486 RepID=UPI002B405EE5|nr:BEL1-like homeodomain protein 9 isoform X2 [Humulus lupulus]